MLHIDMLPSIAKDETTAWRMRFKNVAVFPAKRNDYGEDVVVEPPLVSKAMIFVLSSVRGPLFLHDSVSTS